VPSPSRPPSSLSAMLDLLLGPTSPPASVPAKHHFKTKQTKADPPWSPVVVDDLPQRTQQPVEALERVGAPARPADRASPIWPACVPPVRGACPFALGGQGQRVLPLPLSGRWVKGACMPPDRPRGAWQIVTGVRDIHRACWRAGPQSAVREITLE